MVVDNFKEFNSFKKWTAQDGTPENKISIFIFVIGWALFSISILLGIFIIIDSVDFIALLPFAVTALIAGIVLIGIAEIIKLLTSIIDQLKKKS
ncbi:hypothetical protein [Gracilibacillus massiliensis]|uniref:hypothetical protein n=1 Tax=Gracilibacillus massiliensis TaxID=1564956 RepID=UPI00071C6493|nr:hypothetical protein [Gracilibacillus massiliensis]